MAAESYTWASPRMRTCRGSCFRSLDQLVGVPIPGAEGGHAPFLSPDGEWVGFVPLSNQRLLQRIPTSGGSPTTITESPSAIYGASWGADDQIVFSALSGVYSVPAGGGQALVLTLPDRDGGEAYRMWPSIIPKQRAVVLSISTSGVLATGELAILELDTGTVTRLGIPGSSPRYVSTGHLVFAASDGSVQAVSFDDESLEVTGSPRPGRRGRRHALFRGGTFHGHRGRPSGLHTRSPRKRPSLSGVGPSVTDGKKQSTASYVSLRLCGSRQTEPDWPSGSTARSLTSGSSPLPLVH